MKTLVNEISGRKDFPIFKGTNQQIFNWVKNNLEALDLNEAFSCDFELTEFGEILIFGDEDSKTLRIINVEIIEL